MDFNNLKGQSLGRSASQSLLSTLTGASGVKCVKEIRSDQKSRSVLLLSTLFKSKGKSGLGTDTYPIRAVTKGRGLGAGDFPRLLQV